MATPARYDFEVKRRADYPLRLKLKDGFNVAMDLSGFQVYAAIWNQARTKKYADFATEYVDLGGGEVTLWLSSNDTALLPDDAWYDVLVVEPSGKEYYYLEGIIYAKEGYTEAV